jgi:hypothetical protein
MDELGGREVAKTENSIYYGSKNSILGFYLNNDNLDTFVEVSKEDHNKLMQGVCEGKLVVPDKKGHPILADQERDYQAEAEYKLADRKAELNMISVIAWAAMTKEKQAEWTEYLKALDAISKQKGYPDSIEWPVKPA